MCRILGTMKTFIASLALQINAATTGSIQLFPAGEFRARDGRPAECDAWLMNADIANVLIAAADARDTPYVLDYEHQTLRSASNGQPAPAAAFFKKLEWREGEGLFATDIDWTAAASAMVEAKEYRFISPVFSYDKSGRVIEILNAALTNTPALDGMEEVMLAAASQMAVHLTTKGNAVMDELLERLRWMLNLPITATQEDIIAELNKLINQLSGGEGMAAASVDLLAILSAHEQSIAALTAQVDSPDPAKFVSVEVMQASVRQAVESAGNSMAALATQECETLITAALSDGRLFPAQQDWAKSLAKSDPASLKAFIEKAPKIAALTTTQTGGKPPSSVQQRPAAGDDEEVDTAICSLMGVDPAEVASFVKGAN